MPILDVELVQPPGESPAAGMPAALADAAATAIGNIIKQPEDIPGGIEFAKSIKELSGVLIIKDDKIGLWGKATICRTA